LKQGQRPALQEIRMAATNKSIRESAAAMRKMGETAADGFRLLIFAPEHGIRSRKNTEAILGKDGLLTCDGVQLAAGLRLSHSQRRKG
jgi:hypothetical protein